VKKITLLLVIIFTFLFLTKSWGEWTYVAGNSMGHKIYYDKDRIKKFGEVIYFWELYDLPKQLYGILSTIALVRLDCSILRYKFLQYHAYNKSMGEGVGVDENPSDEWRTPSPNMMGETFYKKICEESQLISSPLNEERIWGVLYLGLRNGVFNFYTEKWEGLESEDNKDYSKYEGEIKNGAPSGQGKSTLSNGETYVGEYENGEPNGQGTEIWNNGNKYVGEHKNGKKHGQGIFTWSDGNNYVGEFKDGERNGQGTEIMNDGKKYVGEFRKNNPWTGTTYDKDGTITGKYVNGEWIKQ